MGIDHFRKYDLNLLITLYVLLEEMSVTRAAARLGLAQSATSRALGRLREQFDDELLIRAGAGMVLTPRAAALREPLGQLLDDLGEFLSIGRYVEPATLNYVFRIATADHPLQVLVPSLIKHLSSVAPGVRLEVSMVTANSEAQVISGELDLLICPRRNDSMGMVWSNLFVDRFVTVARVKHPRLSQISDLTIDMFASERHVVTNPDGPSKVPSPIDKELAALGLTRLVALKVPNFLAALHVASSTELLATVPQRLLGPDNSHSSLLFDVFETPFELNRLVLCMGWHERMRRDPIHAWFRGLLMNVASQES